MSEEVRYSKTITPSDTEVLNPPIHRMYVEGTGDIRFVLEKMWRELTNTISVVTSDATVTVVMENHGMADGDIVVVAGVASAIGGILAANLNGVRTVTVVDENSFTFEAGASASSTVDDSGGTFTINVSTLFTVPDNFWADKFSVRMILDTGTNATGIVGFY